VLEANFTLREAQLREETEALRRELLQRNAWILVTTRAIDEHNRFCTLILQQQRQQQERLLQTEIEDPNTGTTSVQIETQRQQLSTEEINELINESGEQNTESQDPDAEL
jgi:hypothetical protein